MIPHDADDSTIKKIILDNYPEARDKFQHDRIPGDYSCGMLQIVFALEELVLTFLLDAIHDPIG